MKSLFVNSYNNVGVLDLDKFNNTEIVFIQIDVKTKKTTYYEYNHNDESILIPLYNNYAPTLEGLNAKIDLDIKTAYSATYNCSKIIVVYNSNILENQSDNTVGIQMGVCCL